MKTTSIEALMLAILLSLMVGLVVGFLVGKDINGRPTIVIDTSNEEILDKACLYNGIEKADYIIYSGHSFIDTNGERCGLFNNAFRSKIASEQEENE